MTHGVPPELLLAEIRRTFPLQVEIVELRLVNEALRRELADAREAEANPPLSADLPAHIREAMEEVGHRT